MIFIILSDSEDEDIQPRSKQPAPTATLVITPSPSFQPKNMKVKSTILSCLRRVKEEKREDKEALKEGFAMALILSNIPINTIGSRGMKRFLYHLGIHISPNSAQVYK